MTAPHDPAGPSDPGPADPGPPAQSNGERQPGQRPPSAGPPPGPPALQVAGLVKAYGGRTVLDHLDLEVASGESVAVLGRSGSGKTTLLRVVSGLEDLDAGRVAVGGQLVSGEGAFAAPNARGIGYVFQSSALWPHLTVAQNILFGVRSRDKATRNAVVAELLERLEIPGLAGRYPDRLSGGEARRVAIARAIAPSPALLLFDEALTNLDWDLKGRLIDVLNRRVRGSAAMLFVTHDPDEAHRVSDRRLLLSEGRLGPWGSPGI